MKWVPDKVYDFYRKHFGTFTLEDPRPTAQSSPYTYYLPPPDHIEAIEPGDLVKLIFKSEPSGRKYSAERMWANVESRYGDHFSARLDNMPYDMPQLEPGETIEFDGHMIIDIEFQNSDSRPELDALSAPVQKQYWDRCFVDDCVLDGSVRVGYLYRETPWPREGKRKDDKFPDSGWRIRGDVEKMSDEQYEAEAASYIALGKVLNTDDSWIDLIESPIGSAFLINQETGLFEPTEFTGDQEEE